MRTAAKLLQAMRNNPRDRTIDQLLTVAHRYGVEVRNHGGSHHVFSHPAVSEALSIPAHRPIKPIYVRRFITLLDQIKE